MLTAAVRTFGATLASLAVTAAAWLIASLLLTSGIVHATATHGPTRELIDLDTLRQPVMLDARSDAWLDVSGRFTPEAVSDSAAIEWNHTHSGEVHALREGQALWIRFVVPPAADAERWYVDVPQSSVDRITLYARDVDGRWSAQSAGDRIAVNAWPVPHRSPLLPLRVSAAEPRYFLLKIENTSAFGAPLSLVSESHLLQLEQRTSLFLGVYVGLTVLALALALGGAVSQRDGAYLRYALAVGLAALTQASVTGIAGLHLWPSAPTWNDLAAPVLPTLATAALVWFAAGAMSLAERSRAVNRFAVGVAAIGVGLAFFLPFLRGQVRVDAVVGYVGAAVMAITFIAIWAIRRGDALTPWLAVGLAPVALSALFPIGRALGWLPSGFLSNHGMQIAGAVEFPVLLFTLTLRNQQRREHARRVAGIDRVDPETGLVTSAVFVERLTRQIARNRRGGQVGAVLVLDLVNDAEIERKFDRRAAAELPLRLAGRLLGSVRDIDTVGRIGNRRFALLMEGPLGAEAARAEGPRIVARCLMPFEGRSVDYVARVRIAQTPIPAGALDAAQTMRRLEHILDRVPDTDRRGVFNLSARGGDSDAPTPDVAERGLPPDAPLAPL